MSDNPDFIKVAAGQFFHRSQIMSVRRLTKTTNGKTWIVSVSAESVGGVPYNKIWITEADAKRLCPLLGIEYEEEGGQE